MNLCWQGMELNVRYWQVDHNGGHLEGVEMNLLAWKWVS
jgi:hypothetical protein